MFALAWSLYASLFSDPEYKVLIIGLESSGKTTLMEQLKCMYAEGRTSTSATDAAPTPAPATIMRGKRIQPTVGLNTSRITHRTIARKAPVGSRSGSFCHREDVDCRASGPSTPSSIEKSISAFAPTSTRLILWDVGGSLRTLWANYFAPCHGVIFVVDSTLGTTANLSNVTNSTDDSAASVADFGDSLVASPASQAGANGDGNNMNALGGSSVLTEEIKKRSGGRAQLHGEQRCQSRWRAYARNAAVLREVFLHPLLSDAPLLIMLNKVDVEEHCSIVELQEALELVQMALAENVYDWGCVVDPPGPAQRCASTEDGMDDLSASMSSGSRLLGNIDVMGTSGIGKKVLRMVEVSALDGTGVREAMDWLTLQMRDSKRSVWADDG